MRVSCPRHRGGFDSSFALAMCSFLLRSIKQLAFFQRSSIGCAAGGMLYLATCSVECKPRRQPMPLSVALSH